MHRWNLSLAAALIVSPALAQTRVNPTVSAVREVQTEATSESWTAQSNVSFLGSALPRDYLRTTLDLDKNNRRPTRAEHFYSHRGYTIPETRVDRFEWNSSVEFAVSPWISIFAEQPYRWVDPEANANRSGMGDLDFGFKFAFFDSEGFVAAAQLRATAPLAAKTTLDSRHWALEPGLLVNLSLGEWFTLEGDARYWIPLTDDRYAGDVVRYGLGLSLGKRNAHQIVITPVVEAVGWTALGGLVDVVGPMGVTTRSASGQTIVNGAAGARIGFGHAADLYVGYARAFTGDAWYRDLFRVEFRLSF